MVSIPSCVIVIGGNMGSWLIGSSSPSVRCIRVLCNTVIPSAPLELRAIVILPKVCNESISRRCGMIPVVDGR